MVEIPHWKKLIRMHAETDKKISILEMNELAGAFLADDIGKEEFSTFERALADLQIVNHIAKVLQNENHDTVEDLLECIKRCIRLAYASQIIALIEDEQSIMASDPFA
jgi:hypothetical protein